MSMALKERIKRKRARIAELAARIDGLRHELRVLKGQLPPKRDRWRHLGAERYGPPSPQEFNEYVSRIAPQLAESLRVPTHGDI